LFLNRLRPRIDAGAELAERNVDQTVQ